MHCPPRSLDEIIAVVAFEDLTRDEEIGAFDTPTPSEILTITLSKVRAIFYKM